jgi:hypothetical protein
MATITAKAHKRRPVIDDGNVSFERTLPDTADKTALTALSNIRYRSHT